MKELLISLASGLIGKQGRIANAIRVVMRAVATRKNENISVEID